MDQQVIIAGGGLAGSEAAWQLAERGVRVALYEMRPVRTTPAHKTDRLAELVCSNSLKSNAPGSAAWLLKEELRRSGSLLLRLADAAAVPGGAALAVDRDRFAEAVTSTLEQHPLVEIRREEFCEIPDCGGFAWQQPADWLAQSLRPQGTPLDRALALIAPGPLTPDALARQLQALAGSETLAFYDAISPIVDAETLNMERIFRASRYGKGGEDYLNCPMDEREYGASYDALPAAQTVERHSFERLKCF